MPRAAEPDAPAPAGSVPLSVWPTSALPLADGDISVGGVPLTQLAERFGTPAYVLDEGEVRLRCRAYLRAFPEADVFYAAKAFLCRAMANWVQEEGLGLDVCSAGELELAVSTGFPAERIVLHGNAKSPADLRTALRLGVGRIVIDSTSEIARLAALVPAGSRQKVLIRVVPGIAAGGHAKIRTGTDDQKFGLSLTDGSAQHAIARVLGQTGLELVGLHCHLGSQITTVKPYPVGRTTAGRPARPDPRAARRHTARAGSRAAATASPTAPASPHSTSPASAPRSAPNWPAAARRPGCRCPGSPSNRAAPSRARRASPSTGCWPSNRPAHTGSWRWTAG